MSNTFSLKQIERQAWTRYFEDGLWDIWLGFMYLGGGLRSLTGNLWWYLLIAAGVLLLIGGKRWITVPRLGYIKFSPWRETRQMRLKIIVVAAVLLTAVLVFWGLRGGWAYTGWLFVLLVPALFLLMAYMMDFPRLAFYAILIAGTMILTQLYGDPVGAYAQIVLGLLATLIGLAYLLPFLRHNPLPAGQDTERYDHR